MSEKNKQVIAQKTVADDAPKVIDKQEMDRLVSRNVAISVFSKIYYLASRLFLPPLTLMYVDLEQYGLWSICFILISYLGLGAFGISNVYIRYIAEYHAHHRVDKINGLLSTGILLVTGISITLLGALWLWLPHLVTETFEIKPHLQEIAKDLFFGTACIFLLDASLGAFMYVLNGLQKIAETTFVWLFCLTIEALLVFVFLWLGFGIYALLYAFIVRYSLSIIIFIFLSHHLIPGLSVSLKHVERSYLDLFLSFGAVVQIAGVFNIFLHSIDKFIASMSIGSHATALLDVGTRFPVTATSIPGSMTAAILPATSYMHSQQRKQELINLYINGSRTMSLLTGFIMGFLACFSFPIITAWLGTNEEYKIAAIIMILFTLPQQLHILTGPGSAVFNGIAQPLRTLIYPLIRIVFIGIIFLFGFLFFEINILNISIMVALASSIGAMVYHFYINFVVGVTNALFFRRVLIPGLFPYVLGYGLYYYLQDWAEMALASRSESIIFVLFSGTIYTLVVPLFIYWGIYSSDERNKLRVRVLRMLLKITDKLKVSIHH